MVVIIDLEPGTKPEPYRSKYHTISHQVLDLEAELGTTDSDYRTLDNLIDEAKRRITAKDQYTKEEAIGILGAIDRILPENEFKFENNGLLFNQGLKAATLDCYSSTFIYLSIAEAMNLPLVAVNAPNHVLVRWILGNGQYFNWGTTSAKEQSDDYLKTRYGITQRFIDNGAYLTGLTHEEAIAHAYNRRGVALGEKGNFDEAIRDIDEAIHLNPRVPYFYRNSRKAMHMNSQQRT